MKYVIILLSVFVLAACKQQPKPAAVVNSDVYYTCSMHPQVVQPNPGNCPICGMKLIAVSKKKTGASNSLMLSDQQMMLGNIKTDTIRKGSISNDMVLTGVLNFNQNNKNVVSARLSGRVERLFFKNIGDYIGKGQKVFELYSEELNNAKQEYLLLLEKKRTLDNSIMDFTQLIQSAKNKLLLWGMTNAQIKELERTGKASNLTTFYSTASGYVTELGVQEGDYVMEGSPVVTLADLTSLWAEAQLYTSQLSYLDRHAQALVQLPDFPDKQYAGKIEFVNPEITSNDARITLVRVSIPNNAGLKPGMPAYIVIKNKQRKNLLLPADAVVRREKGSLVWVQTAHNTFTSKMVTIGSEANGQLEILSGLSEGDVVVTSGTYLLQSEYEFKNGSGSMEGMKM